MVLEKPHTILFKKKIVSLYRKYFRSQKRLPLGRFFWMFPRTMMCMQNYYTVNIYIYII